ncbi:protein of unknown function [Magnetospirillum sp. XM-1]|nr:protein of unknown function [Magnetospirillum sp. XM-1]
MAIWDSFTNTEGRGQQKRASRHERPLMGEAEDAAARKRRATLSGNAFRCSAQAANQRGFLHPRSQPAKTLNNEDSACRQQIGPVTRL